MHPDFESGYAGNTLEERMELKHAHDSGTRLEVMAMLEPMIETGEQRAHYNKLVNEVEYIATGQKDEQQHEERRHLRRRQRIEAAAAAGVGFEDFGAEEEAALDAAEEEGYLREDEESDGWEEEEDEDDDDDFDESYDAVSFRRFYFAFFFKLIFFISLYFAV